MVARKLLLLFGTTAVAPTITSSAPPDPAYGVAYSHSYTATGTPAPTWSVTVGSLPTGLSLHATTGVLSGTPTASGSWSFTVRATNAGGYAEQAVSGTVLPGFMVTTTGAQTLTIASFTVSSSTTIYWGDGNSDAYTGSGTRTHNYASAGTWNVYFSSASTVTALTLADNKITLNSAGIKACVNITDMQISSLKAGTFNSSDVSAWRPTIFGLYAMPASYTFVFTAGGFGAWTAASDVNMSGNALSPTQVDQILADFYTALATRTASGGTMNLGGSNAAPSGTLGAACPPTTGKEYAYELANDSCAVNPTKKWTTVTITA